MGGWECVAALRLWWWWLLLWWWWWLAVFVSKIARWFRCRRRWVGGWRCSWARSRGGLGVGGGALAAGGFRGHDRAVVQVSAAVRWRLAVCVGTTARRFRCRRRCVGGRRFSCPRPRGGPSHCACRRRQSSCVVGTLRPPAGALQRGGDPRDLLFGGGPRLLGFLYAVACAALSGGGRCLWSPGSVPLAASSPYGTSPVRWCKAGSLLLWSGFARLDTTGPARLAAPADAARGPEPTPRMVRSDTTQHGAGRAGPSPARRAVASEKHRSGPRRGRCPGRGVRECRVCA
ncbi:hypothetical protein ABH935_002139 [Catenulispora sp. GAS73]